VPVSASPARTSKKRPRSPNAESDDRDLANAAPNAATALAADAALFAASNQSVATTISSSPLSSVGFITTAAAPVAPDEVKNSSAATPALPNVRKKPKIDRAAAEGKGSGSGSGSATKTNSSQVKKTTALKPTVGRPTLLTQTVLTGGSGAVTATLKTRKSGVVNRSADDDDEDVVILSRKKGDKMDTSS